jgi:hypothetical protein
MDFKCGQSEDESEAMMSIYRSNKDVTVAGCSSAYEELRGLLLGIGSSRQLREIFNASLIRYVKVTAAVIKLSSGTITSSSCAFDIISGAVASSNARIHELRQHLENRRELARHITALDLTRRQRMTLFTHLYEEMCVTYKPRTLRNWCRRLRAQVLSSEIRRTTLEQEVSVLKLQIAALKGGYEHMLKQSRDAHDVRNARLRQLRDALTDGQLCVISFRINVTPDHYLLLRIPCTLCRDTTSRLDEVTVRPPDFVTHYNANADQPLVFPSDKTFTQSVNLFDVSDRDVLSTSATSGVTMPISLRSKGLFSRRERELEQEASRLYIDLIQRRTHQKYERERIYITKLLRLGRNWRPSVPTTKQLQLHITHIFRLTTSHTPTLDVGATDLSGLWPLEKETLVELARWKAIKTAEFGNTSVDLTSSDAWSPETWRTMTFWTQHLRDILEAPGLLMFQQCGAAYSSENVHDEYGRWAFVGERALHTTDTKRNSVKQYDAASYIALDNIEFGNTEWRNVRLHANYNHSLSYAPLFVAHRTGTLRDETHLDRKTMRLAHEATVAVAHKATAAIASPEDMAHVISGQSVSGQTPRRSELRYCAATQVSEYTQYDRALARKYYDDDCVLHEALVTEVNGRGMRYAFPLHIFDRLAGCIFTHIVVRGVVRLVLDYFGAFVIQTQLTTSVSRSMSHHSYPVPHFPSPIA